MSTSPAATRNGDHVAHPVRPIVLGLLIVLAQRSTPAAELPAALAEVALDGYVIGDGTLHRTLQRMRVDGLIQEVPGGALQEDDPVAGEGARTYEVTELGRGVLQRDVTALHRLVDAAAERQLVSLGSAGLGPAPDDARLTPVPEDFTTVAPHLIVQGAERASEFYQAAFGAEELFRDADENGQIWHLELLIGGTRIATCDENQQMQLMSPNSSHVRSSVIHYFVPDVDATYQAAVAAGATSLMPPDDTYFGYRYAQVEDPFGHRWGLAARHDDGDLSPEQTRRSAQEWRRSNPELVLNVAEWM